MSKRYLSLVALIIVGSFSTVSSWNARTSRKNIMPICRRDAVIKSSGFVSSLLLQPTTSTSARNLPEQTATDLSKTGSVETLIPIVRMEEALQKVRSDLENKRESGIQLSELAGDFPSDEKSFKALFDAYSEPVSYKQKFLDQNAFLVYYTKGFDGPGRPSIETDLPVRQTLQYGARNEAWIAWEDFLSELDFARRNPDEAEIEDLLKPLSRTIDAVNTYLCLAPEDDLRKARNPPK